jgi:hypothetical protein
MANHLDDRLNLTGHRPNTAGNARGRRIAHWPTPPATHMCRYVRPCAEGEVCYVAEGSSEASDSLVTSSPVVDILGRSGGGVWVGG